MVQALNISRFWLPVTEAVVFIGALGANVCLQELDIRGNDLDEVFGAAVATTLTTNNTLEILRVCQNYTAPLGAADLAGALKPNDTLAFLDASGNC